MPTHATLGLDGRVPAEQLPAGGGDGVTDHGALTGLTDDDHTQYHTDARGDARYAALGHNHTGTYQPLATVLTNTTASFTTEQETKLSGIEDGATADMSGSEIVAAIDAQLGSTDWQRGGGGSDSWTWTKLASNSTVSTTAYADVTGMSFTAAANTTYLVELMGAYQTAATTTGIGLAMDIPSGSVIGSVTVHTNATAHGGVEQIADATTTGASTGVRAVNTNTPIRGKWVIAVGATGGTVQLKQRSEIAASNTVLQAGLTILGYRVV